MKSQILIAANIRGASNLPKTDRLSQVDPYVRLVCQTNTKKTSTRSNEPNPRWNKTLVVPAEVDLAEPTGRFRLEVWDKDVRNDELVGSASLDLAALVRQGRIDGPVELTLAAGVPTAPGICQLDVTVTYQLGYATFRQRLGEVEGLVADDKHQRLLLPTPALGPGVYLSVEFESRELELKLTVADPKNRYHYDFATEGSERIKLRRREYDPPKVRGALSVVQEIKADDLAINADFSNLSIVRHVVEPVGRQTVADVIAAAGGQDLGSFDFDRAADVLGTSADVVVDRKKQRIYVPHEGVHLCVDFDEETFDVKVFIHAETDAATQFDLECAGRKYPKSNKFYDPAKRIAQVPCSRCVQLEDLPGGRTDLNDITLSRIQLTNPERWALSDLLPLRS